MKFRKGDIISIECELGIDCDDPGLLDLDVDLHKTGPWKLVKRASETKEEQNTYCYMCGGSGFLRRLIPGDEDYNTKEIPCFVCQRQTKSGA